MLEKIFRPLILSSASPARRALLARLGLPFVSFSPDIDETPLADENVEALVKRLALEKAQKAVQQYSNALIIGSDQVGVIDNHFLTKPLNHENAIKQLSAVSGQKVRFFTGLCLLDATNQHSQVDIITYDVYFRELSPQVIENYLQAEKPYHCAGSFQVEGLGITLVERFEGEDFTALIGLPLIRLVTFLGNVKLR